MLRFCKVEVVKMQIGAVLQDFDFLERFQIDL